MSLEAPRFASVEDRKGCGPAQDDE